VFGDKASSQNRWCCIISTFRPAGGHCPALNPKSEHKPSSFSDEIEECEALQCARRRRHVLVGDLNVAPHENDVCRNGSS